MKRSSGKIQMTSSKQHGVKSIHNAASLLRTVAGKNERGASLRYLSKALDLHVETARRMLKALVKEGLLIHDTETRLYHLGLELYNFGSAAFQFTMRDLARPVLEKIAHETEDMVFLGIKSGTDVLPIDRVEGSFPIRAMTQEIGERLPLGIGSGSLAILASLPDSNIKKILRSNQRRYSRYNNRSSQWVRAQIPLVRKQGYAVSKGNVIAGATAVGVSILNSKGHVLGSISVSSISKRMPESRQPEVAKLLCEEIESIDWEILK